MNLTKYHFFMTLYGIGLTAVLLAGYNLVGEHFKKVAYEKPTHFELKASPDDVIHSDAYTAKDGEAEVKYAYLTEPMEALPNEDVTLRTPQSQTVEIGTYKNEEGNTMRELKTTFLPKPQFYQDKDGVWRQIEYATTTEEIFSQSGAIPYIAKREFFERLTGAKPVYALSATYYPDPNTESTSVDGYVQYNATLGGLCDWSLMRDATIGHSVDDSGTTIPISLYILYIDDPVFSCYYDMGRIFLLFDTSALPNNATISAATLSVYVTAKDNGDNDGDDTLNVVTTTPASNTALSTADFDQLGTTLQASAIDITSISTGAYTDFTLNSTGRGNISLTSITKFGLREGHDVGNVQIAEGSTNGITAYSADQTGTANDPKLAVTYTIPAAFSMGNWFPF